MISHRQWERDWLIDDFIRTICNPTILSVPLWSYHFVQYQFVRIPFCPDHVCIYVLYIDGWMYGWINEWKNGKTNRKATWRMNGWTNGRKVENGEGREDVERVVLDVRLWPIGLCDLKQNSQLQYTYLSSITNHSLYPSSWPEISKHYVFTGDWWTLVHSVPLSTKMESTTTSLRNSNSLTSFKKLLKAHYFSLAFQHLDVLLRFLSADYPRLSLTLRCDPERFTNITTNISLNTLCICAYFCDHIKS